LTLRRVWVIEALRLKQVRNRPTRLMRKRIGSCATRRGLTVKKMYCWRCEMEVPMLDEDEFAIVEQR
jgi:hypothetical protein